jgi:hypothetical protein
MENLFIPYEQALILKELGFDEPCFRFKNNISNIVEEKGWLNWNEVEKFVSLPLYQQAFKFFREKYDLQCWPEVTGSNRYSCRYDGNDETGKRWVGYLKDYNGQSVLYSKYEEAELVCLKKLIEIKNK